MYHALGKSYSQLESEGFVVVEPNIWTRAGAKSIFVLFGGLACVPRPTTAETPSDLPAGKVGATLLQTDAVCAFDRTAWFDRNSLLRAHVRCHIYRDLVVGSPPTALRPR